MYLLQHCSKTRLQVPPPRPLTIDSTSDSNAHASPKKMNGILLDQICRERKVGNRVSRSEEINQQQGNKGLQMGQENASIMLLQV
jgi:hypothetical protein